MNLRQSLFRTALVAATAVCLPPVSNAADSISLELGLGEKVKMARVGIQWKWDRQWWKSNGSHIGGYWDLTLAQWRGTRFQNVPGSGQDITVLGFTPIFRWQSDSQKGLYAEAGIGLHLLSELYDNNNKRLSTRFQFGDHIGVGYVFQNSVDVGFAIQHFSNGGIKKPNNGVDFAVLRVNYPF